MAKATGGNATSSGLFHLWQGSANGRQLAIVAQLPIRENVNEKAQPTPAAFHTNAAARRHLAKIKDLQAAASAEAAAGNDAKRVENRARRAAGLRPLSYAKVLPLEYQRVEILRCNLPLAQCAICRKHIALHECAGG